MPTLLDASRTDLEPRAFLGTIGAIFATFDARTQDSGNISFGVESEGARYFVKTAGDPADQTPFLAHAQRIALLENAAALARDLTHPALPRLLNIIASPWGPMLAYRWVDGALLRAVKGDPASAHERFRALPATAIAAALDTVIEVHAQLAARGWIASDFYDGALIYDFDNARLSLVDLDHYQRGPFINEMGRLFGSSRFMAPEEFERGARIDERTTVFTLGRTISVFFGDGTLARAPFRGDHALHEVTTRACAPAREKRFALVADFAAHWISARRAMS